MTARATANHRDDEAVQAVLSRYAGIAGNAEAFAEALNRPLAPCVWAHPLRLTRDRLAALLAEERISSQPVEWSDSALRLDIDSRPGLTWPYRVGLMQIQEEAAMLPVRLLDPRPGERILDLCAAPGNKTAQIALALGNRGTVVANDRNAGRLAPLHAAISRLGLMNVSTTARSGVSYPVDNASFDKVLVDAPCSGEGTVRKGTGTHRPVSAAFRHWLGGTQYALLNRATDLCRPGGRIVYATCTLAPEENEAILDQILKERPSDLRVVDATVPGLRTSPGITRWRSRTYGDAVAGAMRLWPHIADTSGFFVVLLARTGPAAETPKPGDHYPEDKSISARCGKFIDQFGFPQTIFARTTIIGDGNQRRLVAHDHRPPATPPAVATGLAFTRDRARPKLSTQAAQSFGAAATRNVIELERSGVDVYLDRGTVRLDTGRAAACDGPGHVLVRYRGFALGLADLRDDGGTWIVDSLFPRQRG